MRHIIASVLTVFIIGSAALFQGCSQDSYDADLYYEEAAGTSSYESGVIDAEPKAEPVGAKVSTGGEFKPKFTHDILTAILQEFLIHSLELMFIHAPHKKWQNCILRFTISTPA